MKREIRDKWVKALRSGRYKQGQGSLRSADNYFCCLGVLYDVCDSDGWEPVFEHICDEDSASYAVRDRVLECDLPEEWLPDGYQGLRRYDHQSDLAKLNDNGDSFSEIADYIEQNIPVED